MAVYRFSILRLASLVVFAFGIGLIIIWICISLYRNDLVYWNVKHIFDAKTDLKIDLTELRGGQTVEEIKKQFPYLDWYCTAETHNLGDHVCTDEHLASWNGNPAMLAAFWFKKGHLAHVMINVPNEKHMHVRAYLIRSLGRPDARDRREMTQSDLVVWELDSGAGIVFNIDREPDPLQWSTVLWYSPEEVRRVGGLVKHGQSSDMKDVDLTEEVARKVVRKLLSQ